MVQTVVGLQQLRDHLDLGVRDLIPARCVMRADRPYDSGRDHVTRCFSSRSSIDSWSSTAREILVMVVSLFALCKCRTGMFVRTHGAPNAGK